ncbi:GNAT family N-acetyltransferase [Streptomyces sp. NPDC050421]|uniref:GNAT family N-acetyltransferase n=1 Tax=unclassified Streptomyces TaxID=2593676 RepID=UPI0037A6ABFF
MAAFSEDWPARTIVRLWSEKSGATSSQVAVLARLFVASGARKGSAGKHLMDAAVSYARATKLRLVLEVLVKDAAVIRLYERLGWHRFGETVHTIASGELMSVVMWSARSRCYQADRRSRRSLGVCSCRPLPVSVRSR